MRNEWRCEKSEKLLESLAKLADSRAALYSTRVPTRDSTEQVDDHLFGAIHYAVVLYVEARAESLDVGDVTRIMNDGIDGFEKMQVRYGELSETTRQRIMRPSVEALGKIKELLKGGRTNHKKIHEILRAYKFRMRGHGPGKDIIAQEMRRIGSLVESVTQGEMDWSEFTSLAEDQINSAETRLAEQNSSTR